MFIGFARLSATKEGAFQNEPDQIASLVGGDRSGSNGALLYFCKDGYSGGSTTIGVHARAGGQGELYTILDGAPTYKSETTGLAFSPDKMRMYVSFQGGTGWVHPGIIFELTRDDCLPFDAKTLDIKYHA